MRVMMSVATTAVTTIAPIAIAATLTITVVAVRRRQEPHKI